MNTPNVSSQASLEPTDQNLPYTSASLLCYMASGYAAPTLFMQTHAGLRPKGDQASQGDSRR